VITAHGIPPRADDSIVQRIYLIFAEAEDRPIGVGGTWTLHEENPLYKEIRILREETSISGIVKNSRGQPVAGAAVASWQVDGRPVPGILSATTDTDGHFEIKRIQFFKKNGGSDFTVSHPDYPVTHFPDVQLPANVSFSLPDGCNVSGTVIDSVTGKPGVFSLVLAQGEKSVSGIPAFSGGDGRFQFILAEGRYNFLAQRKSRICVAITDQEFIAGENVELPPLQLIKGGFISGRVINTATGKPTTVTDAARSASNDPGPRKDRIKIIKCVMLGINMDKWDEMAIWSEP